MSKNIILENVNLIDATGNKPIPNASVLITNDKIASISSKEKIISLDNCKKFNLQGYTLMPGLIDLHTHAAMTEQLMPVLMGKASSGNSMIHALQTAKALEKTLTAGFTTVRDAGTANKDIKEAIEQGFIKGPKLLISCAILTQTGGHIDSRNCLSSQNGVDWIGISAGSIVCDGIDEVIKATRKQIRAGADWIKVMASGGVLSPHDKLMSSQYNIQELKAIVETANSDGIKVAAHCHSETSIRNCISAGIKTIEHGTFINDKLIELMSKNNIALVPTLYVMKKIKIDELPKTQREKAIYVIEKSCETLTNAFKRKSEILIGSGTDCLGDKDAGKNALELKYKVDMGYTPMESIMSATKINAQILDLDNEIGTIETGKKANLIVVKGDPSKDIKVLCNPDNIKLILLDGKIVKNII